MRHSESHLAMQRTRNNPLTNKQEDLHCDTGARIDKTMKGENKRVQKQPHTYKHTSGL